jgi:hypothetical protein
MSQDTGLVRAVKAVLFVFSILWGFACAELMASLWAVIPDSQAHVVRYPLTGLMVAIGCVATAWVPLWLLWTYIDGKDSQEPR